MVDYNLRAQEVGYLPEHVDANTFLPWVDSTMLELMATGKFGSAATHSLLKGVTNNDETYDYGQVDPVTGKPIQKIPKFMLYEITNPTDNVLAAYAQFANFVENYAELSKVQGLVRTLSYIERAKGSLATTKAGRLIEGSQEVASNQTNADLLDSMISAIVYGHKNASGKDFDLYLGKVPEMLRKINDAVGYKLFDESYIGKSISFSRSMDSLVSYTQAKVLSLNPLSSISNFLGGHYQSIINAGTYFTKKDFVSSEGTWTSSKMKNDKELQYINAAFDYFLIGEHSNPTEVAVRRLKGKASSEAIRDYLAVGLRSGDIAVRYTNGLALIDNMIVVDGKVLNAREYVRDSPAYQERYTRGDVANSEKAFESMVADVKNKYGLRKVAKIVDGEMIIPGVDPLDASVKRMIAVHNDLIEKAIGPMADYQRRAINLSMIGRAAMLFKNWMPPLLEQRYGALKFNTATERMEWGRARTMWKFLAPEFGKRLSTFQSTLKATGEGMKNLEKFYEETKADYEKKTGKAFKMSQPEFYDMVRKNIRDSAYDLLGAAVMFGGFVAMSNYLQTERDQGQASTNNQKFFLRALDKVKDEAAFFYDPRNLSSLLGTSVFPAARTMQDFSKFFTHVIEKSWGFAIQDGKAVDRIHLIKDGLKMIPGVSQITTLTPLFMNGLAKDLDIQVNLPQNFTY